MGAGLLGSLFPASRGGWGLGARWCHRLLARCAAGRAGSDGRSLVPRGSGCLVSGAAAASAKGRLPAGSFVPPLYLALLSARRSWGHRCQGCRQRRVAASAVPGPAGKGCAHRAGETRPEQRAPPWKAVAHLRQGVAGLHSLLARQRHLPGGESCCHTLAAAAPFASAASTSLTESPRGTHPSRPGPGLPHGGDPSPLRSGWSHPGTPSPKHCRTGVHGAVVAQPSSQPDQWTDQANTTRGSMAACIEAQQR